MEDQRPFEQPRFTLQEWAEAVCVDEKAAQYVVQNINMSKWAMSLSFRGELRYWEMAADFCLPRDWEGFKVNK